MPDKTVVEGHRIAAVQDGSFQALIFKILS